MPVCREKLDLFSRQRRQSTGRTGGRTTTGPIAVGSFAWRHSCANRESDCLSVSRTSTRQTGPRTKFAWKSALSRMAREPIPRWTRSASQTSHRQESKEPKKADTAQSLARLDFLYDRGGPSPNHEGFSSGEGRRGRRSATEGKTQPGSLRAQRPPLTTGVGGISPVAGSVLAAVS